ncbi:uncharacterized protein LOC130736132 [Lotus japonicus]|uniref:uncharacterized protein LOC130736132 n=1 Tax=Lotus japonicus TaxID=34305 RepID=UPI00258BA8C7|nr:uncharacterized protein LOC130736132 [Lotus japonicus]
MPGEAVAKEYSTSWRGRDKEYLLCLEMHVQEYSFCLERQGQRKINAWRGSLKVNFHKRKLAGIAVEWDNLSKYASLLNCKLMTVSFVYLGIPVSGRPNGVQLWGPVIRKFRIKFSKCKKKVPLVEALNEEFPCPWNLFGERMWDAGMLVHHVAHICVESQGLGILSNVACMLCTRLMRNFVWGGSEEANKIAWVSWENVCKPKESGGLRVKDLFSFNRGLIGKWIWRYLNEPDSLWCKVIKAQSDHYHCASSWRRDVMSLCYVDNSDWFTYGLGNVVGGGDQNLFWYEDWLGSGSLARRFHKLYNLSKNKYSMVKEVGE